MDTKNNILDNESAQLPAGWVVKKLGDVIDFKNGKKRPSNTGIIPIYGGNGILGYCADSNNENSIIIGRVGAYCGSVFYESEKCWVSDNAIAANSSDGINIIFAYYMLKSLHLNKRQIGTGQPLITQEILSNILILFPPIEEQKEIASILSSLDDKIELNQQINKKLEEMAQTIFKEWFIDFNFPDENGNPYRDSGGAMVNSELGLIPASWSVGKLGNYIVLNKGKSYKSTELVDDGLPMINLKTFGRDGSFRHDGIKYFDGQYKDAHIVKSGNLVISMTDVTQQAEIIGNPLIIPNYLDKAIISLDVSSITPCGFLTRAYLYFLLKNRHFKESMKGFSSGTTVLHLNKDGILNYKFALPPKDIIERIDDFLGSTLSSINLNDEKSIAIEHVRNSLLPKLMSGQINLFTREK